MCYPVAERMNYCRYVYMHLLCYDLGVKCKVGSLTSKYCGGCRLWTSHPSHISVEEEAQGHLTTLRV